MRDPAPDHSTPRYERPNQPWICGQTEHGNACPTGPIDRGHCPALAECAPTRDGDRWKCNRSPLRGGPCGEGPQPDGACSRIHKCHPMRSLRAKRGRFVIALSLLAIGGIFITLSADWRDRAIRPGPLARQHAQILENRETGASACGACHSAAAQNIAGWALSVVTFPSGHPTQSQLCMNCHSKSIAKDFALAAHNLAPELLEQITGESPNPSASARNPNAQRQLACSACHREHHGATVDLTAIDNDACQSCHQQHYQSLAASHPDFGNWPYKRRTPIAFNHATHQGKHFTEKKQTFDCQTCHAVGAAGNVEQTASYEKSCAACHDEKIATSVGPGVSMFAIPTLDVAAIRKAGRDIGSWPAAATGDFDGKLPPTMKLLLAADPAAAQAIAKLGVNFEFQDVAPDNIEQVAASAEIGKAIKGLMTDLGALGPTAIRERLSTVLGRKVSDAEAAGLAAGLSSDTLSGAATWLSGQSKPNAVSPGAALTTITASANSYGPSGSWSSDTATLSVRYRPAVHADPVLGSWLAVLANTPNLESRPLAAATFKELTRPTAPGLCASCHSVEQHSTNTLAINWRATDHTTEPRGFTKFAHGPHLVLPQLANCTACHAIDAAANTATSYATTNPQQFASEFKPITKQFCSQCHTPTAAGDRCQMCHNYHVQTAESWRLDQAKNGLNRQAFQIDISDFDLRVGERVRQFGIRNPQSAIR